MDNHWDNHVDALYAAVGKREELALAFSAFLPYFDAQKVGLITTPHVLRPNGAVVISHGISDESHVSYQAHYGAEDEWVKGSVAQNGVQAGFVFLGSELVPPDQIVKTRFWREYCVPQKHFDVVGCVLETPDADHTALTFLSFIRAEDTRPIRPQAKVYVQALMPHARRVLNLHRRLAPQLAVGRSLLEIFERMALPMLFINAATEVMQANSGAERLLRQARLLRRGLLGRLQMADGSRWQDLHVHLARLAIDPGFDIVLEPVDGTDTEGKVLQVLTLQTVHVEFGDNLTQPSAQAVISVRPASLQQHGALLRQHFGLTEAELGVARFLVEGLSPQAVADRLDVRISTVRTHIARLLNKTSSTRQNEMLRRLGALD